MFGCRMWRSHGSRMTAISRASNGGLLYDQKEDGNPERAPSSSDRRNEHGPVAFDLAKRVGEAIYGVDCLRFA
jgi:hypothetical protein